MSSWSWRQREEWKTSPGKSVEAGYVGEQGFVPGSRRGYQEPGRVVVAAGLDVPAGVGGVPLRPGDLGAVADERGDAVRGRRVAEVGADLGLAGEGPRPLRVGCEGVRVQGGGHVAGAARVGVVAPGAAQVVRLLTGEQDRHFTAPVWISEFGAGGREETGARQRAWFENFVDQLIRADADFAYWPLVGWHENRTGNGWALLHWDAAGNRMGLYDGDDWRATAWTRLVGAQGRTGRVAPVADWAMLSPDHGDFVASRRMRALPDWDPGARKAVCPDGRRLIGLSHTGNRGLCSNVSVGPVWDPAAAPKVVVDERYVAPGRDWASGYTKLQCPEGHFLTGYSVRGAAVSAALCVPAPPGSIGGTSGRTVWFDRGDNRGATPKGGDFAQGHYKGQCADHEYAAGIAYTARVGSSRTPDALYCRQTS